MQTQKVFHALSVLAIIALLIGCNEGKTTEGETVSPVLKTDVLTMPAIGKVSSIKGEILVLKNVSKGEGYRSLSTKDVIDDGDIIVLKERSKLELIFGDHKKKSIETGDVAHWYTARVEQP